MAAPRLILPEHKARFLDLLAVGLTVASACAELGVARHTMYWHRARDPGFRAAWDATAARRLEARRGAVAGDRALSGAGAGAPPDLGPGSGPRTTVPRSAASGAS
ncbi:hypothetical protein [Solirhodobacter olei]|uniref:hypothetical protein n=1 Tax=Solirhodobacter olei TaxID=2493082 RepID=UPI000FDC21C2|nr:hypothetical protein [Solirhodobacter olei]